MPLQERTCPTCQTTASSVDSYCSSCGAKLPQIITTARDFVPLIMSGTGRPADVHPLHIVPDTSRQRQRVVRRGLALLATIAVTCLFAVSLWLLGERDRDASALVLAAGSGAITLALLGGWAYFAVKRARKRARLHDWRMSTP